MTAVKEQAVEASVKAACKQLHLPTVGSRAASLAEEASRANHGHLAYLGALLEAELEDRAETVIFLGEPGTGKSHLSIALGIEACMASRRVRFATTASLVNELLEARDDRTLSKVVARYARVELLILDELAYVPLAPPEAELLFQVLDERSERSALIVTTNLPFGEWTKVFPEPRLCKAVVDRLTFNAHIVETGTDSWRFKKTLERQKRKGVAARKPR